MGDDTAVVRTPEGARLPPSLADFVTDRPFRLGGLDGTDWRPEVVLAEGGEGRADPVIVRHGTTGGRVGIVYQKSDDSLTRAQMISEIIFNWLPGVAAGPGDPPSFRRGDCDGNGKVNIADACCALGFLFLEGAAPECLDAADADDMEGVDLADALHLIRWLFERGAEPPAPGPRDCGPNPGGDGLGPCAQRACR